MTTLPKTRININNKLIAMTAVSTPYKAFPIRLATSAVVLLSFINFKSPERG